MGLSVSVVIPNYNYGRYLPATVGSVLAQTCPVLEVIIVDNGSTDDSREIIGRLGDPRVRAVFQENRGQAGARNSGVAAARGDLIAFLDADDIWLPEKLALQVPLFDDPAVGLVYCGMRIVDSDLRPTGAADVVPSARGRILPAFAERAAAPVCGGESTAVVRASVLREAGPFASELSIGTGWDMWRRIAARATVEFRPEALVLYRQHGTNLSRRLDVFERDTELKLERMFADPASRDIVNLRRRAYSVQRIALAGAYIQASSPLRALYWGLRAVGSDPRVLGRALGWPFRFLARRFGGA